MLSVDSDIIWRLVPHQSGRRAVRQREIIAGMSGAFAPTLERYEINTRLRVAHFLAQVAEESDGFCTTEEYASGTAYEGRLGNDRPGDGPRFKGRGLIQLTGRSNYTSIGKALDLPLADRPQSVDEPIVYLLVSCEYWKNRKINPHCDADDIVTVTRLVNGGLNGIEVRRAYLARAKALLAEVAASDVEPPGNGVPVLHRGSDGSGVTLLQQRLAAAGYAVALDGDFGPATELAVKHFQAAAKLDADGIVGAETWKALQPAAPVAAARAKGGRG